MLKDEFDENVSGPSRDCPIGGWRNCRQPQSDKELVLPNENAKGQLPCLPNTSIERCRCASVLDVRPPAEQVL